MKTKQLIDDIIQLRTDAVLKLYDLGKKINELDLEINSDPEITFGKYTGTKLSKLPPSYVLWLFTSGSLDHRENYELKEKLKKLFNVEEKS